MENENRNIFQIQMKLWKAKRQQNSHKIQFWIQWKLMMELIEENGNIQKIKSEAASSNINKNMWRYKQGDNSQISIMLFLKKIQGLKKDNYYFYLDLFL